MRDVARAVESLLDGHQMHVVPSGDPIPYLHVLGPGDDVPAAGAPVYNTIPDIKPDIYAVYFLTPPIDGQRRLSADAPVGLWTLSVMCVAKTPNSCQWLFEGIDSGLRMRRLDLPDRHPTPILYGSGTSFQTDSSVNPPAVTQTSVWRFRLTK